MNSKEPVLAFFVGLFLFIVVVGWFDARLPWPAPERRR
jgi:hypothetical protein